MKPVVIEDNVYIGTGAIILLGVTVHEMSVMGAGAVITKYVPSFTVVVGVPAKVLTNFARKDMIFNE
jgi:galactoside O-acetyltransferase